MSGASGVGRSTLQQAVASARHDSSFEATPARAQDRYRDRGLFAHEWFRDAYLPLTAMMSDLGALAQVAARHGRGPLRDALYGEQRRLQTLSRAVEDAHGFMQSDWKRYDANPFLVGASLLAELGAFRKAPALTGFDWSRFDAGLERLRVFSGVGSGR